MKPNDEQKRQILDEYYEAVIALTGLRDSDEGYAEALERYNKSADAYLAAINGTWTPPESKQKRPASNESDQQSFQPGA